MKLCLSGVLSALLTLSLSACGTTFNVPAASANHEAQAARMFVEEMSLAPTDRNASASVAADRFVRVMSRVEPVAEKFCRDHAAPEADVNCDVTIVIDDDMEVRNAYQFYNGDKPMVALTLPLIADVRNEDELAFVLGHEFGHHIGEHIAKQQKQAIAGMLIAGLATAYVQSGNPYTPASVRQSEMDRNMQIGASIGQRAYSQTFELESDTIGTYITKAAGYDPVKGARYFARPEDARSGSGALSFWGTHPPDEKRLATVLATMEAMAEVSGQSTE